MHLILLPGNDKANKEWIEAVASQLSALFESTYIQYYNHWSKPSSSIHFEQELEKLIAYASNQKEYCIFAKSVGVLLTLQGIEMEKLFPQKCFFVGVPLEFARSKSPPVEKLFSNFSIPTLFLQKTADPAMSYSDLEIFLKQQKVQNSRLFEISGNTHRYEDIGKIVREIIAFMSAEGGLGTQARAISK